VRSILNRSSGLWRSGLPSRLAKQVVETGDLLRVSPFGVGCKVGSEYDDEHIFFLVLNLLKTRVG
jgi:hypothetical protein